VHVLHRVDFEPIGRRTTVEHGTTALAAALKAGIGLETVCGGEGTCGKCRVRILHGSVSSVSEQEAKLLRARELDTDTRLACCTKVMSDSRIYLPSSSLSKAQELSISGREGQQMRLDSPIRKRVLSLREPSLEDVRSDLTRIADAYEESLGKALPHMDLRTMREIGIALREGDWVATVATYGGTHVTAVEGGDTSTRCFGIAVDLGTTKVAAYLVDLLSGATVESIGAMNPQIAYGEDVMARATSVLNGVTDDIQMQEEVVSLLNGMIHDLCGRSEVGLNEVFDMTVVGNTAMHHLLLRLPVRQLVRAPYIPAVSEPLTLKASELGVEIASGARIYIPPVVAGFVGPDHVAMLLASELGALDPAVVAIDIGTNTEISLISGRARATTCSCASGPAFEGGHIEFGMRAASGAIDRVSIDGSSGQAAIRTIDGAPAVGICGSGILDCVAELYRAGILNARGHFIPGQEGLRELNGALEYVLVEKQAAGIDEDIVVTQHDVTAVQLAKAAIRASIDILLNDAMVDTSEIRSVVIAGAFGTYMNLQSALVIGLLPRVERARIVQIGDGAGVGAKMMLLSSQSRADAEDLARDGLDYVELTAHPQFPQRFARALIFPLLQ